MLRKVFHKFSLIYTNVILGILVLGTIVACVFLGWKLGLLAGGVAFILLDGLGLIWEIMTYPMHKASIDQQEKQERESFAKETEDNPTLR